MTNLGEVNQQILHELRINPFAVVLLVESWKHPEGRQPLMFTYNGVRITLATDTDREIAPKLTGVEAELAERFGKEGSPK